MPRVLVMDEDGDHPLVFSGLPAFRTFMKRDRDLPDEVIEEVEEHMSKVDMWENAAAKFFWLKVITVERRDDGLPTHIFYKGKSYKVPSHEAIEQWMKDDVTETPDGCEVEPDGDCPHGYESWLKVLRIV